MPSRRSGLRRGRWEGNAVNQGRVYSDLELEYHITREERKGLRSRLLGGWRSSIGDVLAARCFYMIPNQSYVLFSNAE